MIIAVQEDWDQVGLDSSCPRFQLKRRSPPNAFPGAELVGKSLIDYAFSILAVGYSQEILGIWLLELDN